MKVHDWEDTAERPNRYRCRTCGMCSRHRLTDERWTCPSKTYVLHRDQQARKDATRWTYTSRERLVMHARADIEGWPRMSHRDIAEALGISRSRVEQIEAKARRKLAARTRLDAADATS